MQTRVTCIQKKEHKNQKLTERNRKDIRQRYKEGEKAKDLAQQFSVSLPTLYKVLKRARKQEFQTRNSTNKRYRGLFYGFKRLAKIERKVVAKYNARARRYNKSYPWEMFHMDTKLLPAIKGAIKKKQYLFVGIDDYSRELYVYIADNKTQFSACSALEQFINECPYQIDCLYTDNGKEYKWRDDHAVMMLCTEQWIKKRYTRVNRPQTNGKAERVIRTIMEMFHDKHTFTSYEERAKLLKRRVNRYNCAKPHAWIDDQTPYELIDEFYKER